MVRRRLRILSSDRVAANVALAVTGGILMKKIIAALLATAWLPSASAGMLYKCVGPKGQTSVQSVPCPAGHKTEWAKGYVPDRTPQRRPVYSRPPQNNTYYFGDSNSPPSERQRRKAQCEQARANETAIRRRNPDLTNDQRLALQEQTTEACRGL